MLLQSRGSKFAMMILAVVCIIQSAALTYVGVEYMQNRQAHAAQYARLEEKAEPVNTCIIDKRSFSGYVYTYGQIKSKYYLSFKSPYFNGYSPRVQQINFKAGSKVKKGDILMEFTCPEMRFKADALAKEAEQKKIYYDKLYNLKEATSSYEINKALNEYQKSLIEISIMEESLKNLVIKSPFNGTTSNCEVCRGDMPDSNRQLFSLHNQDNLIVEFNVDNNDLKCIRVGNKIAVESIDDSHDLERQIITEATIVGINPYIDDQTGKVKVIAEVSKDFVNGRHHDQALKHNMHVYIYFNKLPLEDVFLVTKSAMIEDGNNYFYVRKVVNNNGQDEIAMVRVEVLDHTHNTFAIQSEQLRCGDQVIIEGGGKHEGQPVVVKKIFEI